MLNQRIRYISSHPQYPRFTQFKKSMAGDSADIVMLLKIEANYNIAINYTTHIVQLISYPY